MSLPKLRISVRGQYSHRDYIKVGPVVLYSRPRVTKSFEDYIDLASVDFNKATMEIGPVSLTVEYNGNTATVVAKGFGYRIGEHDFNVKEIKDGLVLDVPKLEFKGAWVDAVIVFHLAD